MATNTNTVKPIEFEFKQYLPILGQYVLVEIKSNYSKTFSEAELILMASQMIKAHTEKKLSGELAKFIPL